ncbi:MAG TPA: DUF1634 domain-containing protein [Chryseosolibacter sp.]
MADKHPINDIDIESIMGRLLRAGVLLSAIVVLAGSVLYLAERGSSISDHHKFRGEPASLSYPGQIVAQSMDLKSDAIIQLGLIILILTPVARILFSIIGFFLERDYLYVGIGLLVLGIIVLSYLGQLGG